MATRASIESRLKKLEVAVRISAQPSLADHLRAAMQRVLERRRLGRPHPEPPIVDPETDPLDARLRWVWTITRECHAYPVRIGSR